MTALLTIPEVAALFRVGRTKLRAMRRDPGFPTPVRSQRPIKWRSSDIETYLESL
jgi:predicted DNA-binding transcriptional regulator AlpA